MPIYEYACERCDSEFEVEQRITDDPLKRCPSCRSVKVKRLISQTSFVLKGGGWYSDLYSSPKNGKDEKSSAKEDADRGKQADAKEAPTPTEKKKPKSEGNEKDKKDRKGTKSKGAKAAA